MTNFFKRFAQDESGAVTVDWVVLTAAVVGFGILRDECGERSAVEECRHRGISNWTCNSVN